MSIQDLHILPKFCDGWSFLYVDHCRIDQEAKAIAVVNDNGKVPVPCASLALLMLGPGVSITHAAICTLADHGCLVAWCGEDGQRFYASGMGDTRSSANFLHQAKVWADESSHLGVVRRLYQLRFAQKLDPTLTLQQIRGMEGVRVRESYAKMSRETGVPWTGRNYERNNWRAADPINRALSVANACLYGICHAGIVSAGFSAALGFIHTGKMLSFVYDIADLYKADTTVPVAFKAVTQVGQGLEGHVRVLCRDAFVSSRLLERIIPDIQLALGMSVKGRKADALEPHDVESAAPGGLWDADGREVAGGLNRAAESEPELEIDDDGSNR